MENERSISEREVRHPAYTAGPLGEARIMMTTPPKQNASANQAPRGLGYLDGTDPKDPLVAPINSPEIMAKFPPTLIITATRGFEMSGALYTHTQLVKLESTPSCTSGKRCFT